MSPSAEPRPHVFVVDDDPHQLHLAIKRLGRAGLEVITAANGVEALQAMVRNPHVRRMVTDFDMPVLGGDDWIRLLERFCPDWQIVVLSGRDVDPGPFLSFPKPADYGNIAKYLKEGG